MDLKIYLLIIREFGKSDFVVIAARPSVSKTAFSFNIVNNICIKQNLSVGFFTFEMSNKSILRRLISLNSNILIS
ncbi:DnaB-like helicase C-terminal domain-containing protein [Borreliella lusitaniae]|uniref:DnaB-like helicase C-terminal domain-containing protein n=1 Tax=Borreliella lusitaniae TaxID=100177 RepID=UPI003423397E